MTDPNDKLAYFQAITGLTDLQLCTDILAAHNWDLELAVTTFTSTNTSDSVPGSGVSGDNGVNRFETGSSHGGEEWVDGRISDFGEEGGVSGVAGNFQSDFLDYYGENGIGEEWVDGGNVNTELLEGGRNGLNQLEVGGGNGGGEQTAGLAWRLVTLPISIVSGGLGLVSSAIGFGFWVAGGVLNHSLGLIGYNGANRFGNASMATPLVSNEAARFVRDFEREFGRVRPRFVEEGFMEALNRSRQEYKLLFVYLHSVDHPDTQAFCEGSLCSEVVVAFINENFIAWGGSIRDSEGFKMSNGLKASRYPFCAVVMGVTNQRMKIALLQQIEGPTSPEQMLTVLQKVVEESAPVLMSGRLEAEERRTNIRLREEQDAAYQAALEADQARERQKREEQERLEREAAEAERKRIEEEEAQERAAREALEKEAALARRRREKATLLGDEPPKGPGITQVLVRFPGGERKERRFPSSATIQVLYEYVDSLDCLSSEKYNLVSNFPRVIYNEEKYSLTLKEAGLHPQASLFVELDS